MQCAQSSCGIVVCAQILGAAPRSDIDFASIDVFPRVLSRIRITLSFGVLALRGTGESAQDDIPGDVTDLLLGDYTPSAGGPLLVALYSPGSTAQATSSRPRILLSPLDTRSSAPRSSARRRILTVRGIQLIPIRLSLFHLSVRVHPCVTPHVHILTTVILQVVIVDMAGWSRSRIHRSPPTSLQSVMLRTVGGGRSRGVGV